MSGPISIVEGLRSALGLLARAWRRAMAALAVAVGAGWLYLGLRWTGNGSLAAAMLPISLLAVVMAQGALYRLAFEEHRQGGPAERIGPGGLQWGAVEWRLLGMTLLLALLLTFLLLLMMVALIAVAFGFASAGAGFVVAQPQSWGHALHGLGGLIVLALLVAELAGFGWFAMRLCLAAPATVDCGRIQVLSAFGLTKGRVWRILGSMLIIALPLFGIGAVMEAALQGRAPAGPGIWVCSLLYSVGGVFLYLPLMVGLLTYLYRRLGPGEPPVGAS
jgi:hypothetical protein